MKKLFLCILLMISQHAFALSCPNGGVIDKGDSTSVVTQRCGVPDSQSSSVKKISSVQKWVYYKKHSYDNFSSKITVLVRDNAVISISIRDNANNQTCYNITQFNSAGQLMLQTSCVNNEYMPTNTALCGGLFSLNDSGDWVKSLCGEPVTRVKMQEQAVAVTEFTYRTDRVETFRFEDNKLTDWKVGDRIVKDSPPVVAHASVATAGDG
jgi:hypothetical protein